jgi:hypothetical protein
LLDIRCEYDVPRFVDLNSDDQGQWNTIDEHMDEEFFKWFHIAHDFKINKNAIIDLSREVQH